MRRTSGSRTAVLAAAIAVAAVLAGGLAGVGAQTAAVEVTPGAAAPGQQVIVSGFGFLEGESVSVELDGRAMAAVLVNGGGAFQVTGTVPAELLPGVYSLDVRGDMWSQFSLSYEVVASAPTPTATAVPTAAPADSELRVIPEGGKPGEFITVTGGGFEPGEAVTVSFDGAEVATVGTTIAGVFLANLVIPVTTIPGAHLIEVVGALGRELSVEYVVLAGPTPTPSPTAVATSEPTVVATASATPGGLDPTATRSEPPGGEASDDGGLGGGAAGRWSAYPAVFIGVLAGIGALLGWAYLARERRVGV